MMPAAPSSPQRLVALAAVLALVLAAGVVAALRSAGQSDAAAETRLSAVVDVVVVDPDGAERPAVEGEVLARAASVRTGPEGSARLTTGGRVVEVGTAAAIRVDDGTRVTLDGGQVMVVAGEDSPRLELTVGELTVSADDGDVVRVEPGASTRVGVLRGGALVQAGPGRDLEVPRLHQVRIAGAVLPRRPAPLALVGDRWERSVEPGLVSSDVTLNAVAQGLDRGPAGTTLAAVVPASFDAAAAPDVLARRAPETAPSEAALAFAAARAGRVSDADGGAGDEAARYSYARALRDAGGSWGVVAALLEAPTDSIASVLSDLLAGSGVLVGPDPSAPEAPAPAPAPVAAEPAPDGAAPGAGAGPAPTAPSPGAGGSGASGGSGSGFGGGSTSGGAGSGSGSGSGGSGGSGSGGSLPSPPSAPAPLPVDPGTVEDLLDTADDLVGSTTGTVGGITGRATNEAERIAGDGLSPRR